MRWDSVALLASVTLAALPGALPNAATAQGLPANPPLPPVSGSASTPGSLSSVPPDGDGPAPYEPQLERLAERLGTLTYLRNLCGKGDAATWRTRMVTLLDAEARSAARRDRLAGAFNRGFHGYQATYRSCTPSAEQVISRFMAEGDRLARELQARYGGT